MHPCPDGEQNTKRTKNNPDASGGGTGRSNPIVAKNMPVLQPCGQENNNKKEDALSSALPSRISPSILLSAYGRDQPVDPEKNPKSGDQSGERHCSSQYQRRLDLSVGGLGRCLSHSFFRPLPAIPLLT
jgi:hypothetical protein